MSIRLVVTRAAYATALVFPAFLAAQPVVTQPPATSEQRLSVRPKAMRDTLAPSTAVTPRVPRTGAGTLNVMPRDSADRARRDSVERRRVQVQDSLQAAARADTVQQRADSARRAATARDDANRAGMASPQPGTTSPMQPDTQPMTPAPQPRRFGQYGGGFYIGVATGAVVPTGNMRNLGYNSGLNVNVPIGWHPAGSLLGVRLDLGYAQFRGRDFSGDLPDGSTLVLNNINPKVLSATGNLTLRIPLMPSRALAAYAVSGAGIYQFRTFGAKSALGGFLGNDVLSAAPAEFQSVRNKLGAQFGAGLEMGIGGASLFVEARVVNIFASRDDDVQFDDFFGSNRGQNLRWVPLMVGVKMR